MTKADIAERIHNETGFTKKNSAEIIECTLLRKALQCSF